jgi:hypothetical protein
MDMRKFGKEKTALLVEMGFFGFFGLQGRESPESSEGERVCAATRVWPA